MILVFILLLTVFLDFFLPFLIPEKTFDATAWKEAAEKQNASIPLSAEPEKKIFSAIIDPNKVESAVLLKIGIPAGIATNWVKYINKGGRFYRKEDIMKLYGMNKDLYTKIEDYLVISEKIKLPKIKSEFSKETKKSFPEYVKKDSLWKNKYVEKKNVPIVMVGINSADSTQLEALPGIGPTLASRIIKYRRLLGGFYDVIQIKDIYGMSDELWARSSPGLFADKSALKMLDLNFLSLTELGRHPYIGFRQARKVVNCRDKNGKFRSREELVPLFSADSLRRLLPYVLIGSSK